MQQTLITQVLLFDLYLSMCSLSIVSSAHCTRRSVFLGFGASVSSCVDSSGGRSFNTIMGGSFSLACFGFFPFCTTETPPFERVDSIFVCGTIIRYWSKINLLETLHLGFGVWGLGFGVWGLGRSEERR